MSQIKHKSKPLEETIDVSNALGKKVISKKGEKIGKVGYIAIHPKRLTIEGIWVCGPMVCKHYIGKNYIDSINKEATYLKINPLTGLVGKKVFDSGGKELGNVKKVNRSNKTNNLLSVVVKQKGIGGKEVAVAKRNIKTIGSSVVLNIR